MSPLRVSMNPIRVVTARTQAQITRDTQLHILFLLLLLYTLEGVCMRFVYVSIKKKINRTATFFLLSSQTYYISVTQMFYKKKYLHSRPLNRTKSPDLFTM